MILAIGFRCLANIVLIDSGGHLVRLTGDHADEVARSLTGLFYWRCPADSVSANEDASLNLSLTEPHSLANSEPVALEFQERGFRQTAGTERPLVANPRTGATIQRLHADAAHWRVTAPTLRGLVVEAYRTIRQIALAHALGQGYVCLHASSVLDERTQQLIAFLGPSGAGKSTAASAIALAGGRLLSNDKLLVDEAGNVRHFAEAPAITRATLRRFVQAGGDLDAAHSVQPPAHEIFLDHPPLPSLRGIASGAARDKVYFSEHQWAAFCGSEGILQGRLSLAVVLTDRLAGGPKLLDDGAQLATNEHIEPLLPFPDWLQIRPAGRKIAQIPVRTVRVASGLDPASSLSSWMLYAGLL